jgi:hypothetical protein
LISSAPQFVMNVMRVLTRRLRERELRNELMNVDAIIVLDMKFASPWPPS